MALASIPSDLPPPIGIAQMNDPQSPFLYDAVNSKKADPPSIRSGEFMVENIAIAQSLKSLREELKNQPGLADTDFSITHFENWSTTVNTLLLYVKPQTRENVCSIMSAANHLNIKVGMGGAYHTWSPSYPDSGGMLINTCDLILPDSTAKDWTSSHIRLNSERTAVTFVPGVTTGQLVRFFLENNVTFKSDVILPSVTYGGIFSGGCHGVGKSQTTMSDWITSITVVDGCGNIKRIPEDFQNVPGISTDDILSAASASLGLFGVIVEITVTVEPMTNARVRNVFSHKLTVLQDKAALTQLLQDNESLEVFWFPFNSLFDLHINKLDENRVTLTKVDPKSLVHGMIETSDAWDPWQDDLWSREINFTDDSDGLKDPGVPLWSMIMDVVAGGALSIMKSIFGTLIYNLTPVTLALSFKMLKIQYGIFQRDDLVKIPWAIHYRDSIDMNYAYDMEFAFPINIADPQVLVDATKVVIDLATSCASNDSFYEGKSGANRYPLNLCMEFRVMKKSKALMCPASLGSEEHILYIEVLSIVNTPGVKRFFTDISDGWKQLNGVPHWQKQWTFLDNNGSMVNYLKEKYGSNLTKFKQVRDGLQVDPKNLFVNSVYSAVLS